MSIGGIHLITTRCGAIVNLKICVQPTDLRLTKGHIPHLGTGKNHQVESVRRVDLPSTGLVGAGREGSIVARASTPTARPDLGPADSRGTPRFASSRSSRTAPSSNTVPTTSSRTVTRPRSGFSVGCTACHPSSRRAWSGRHGVLRVVELAEWGRTPKRAGGARRPPGRPVAGLRPVRLDSPGEGTISRSGVRSWDRPSYDDLVREQIRTRWTRRRSAGDAELHALLCGAEPGTVD
jgi:hypothetical protein